TRRRRPGDVAIPATGSNARTTGSASGSRRRTRSWRRPSRYGSSPSTARAPPARSGERFLTSFDSIPAQAQAKRLHGAAVREGPAHAYLFQGPAGVGKRRTALAF